MFFINTQNRSVDCNIKSRLYFAEETQGQLTSLLIILLIFQITLQSFFNTSLASVSNSNILYVTT